MSLTNTYIAFSFLGLLSALVLLIVPKINYIFKAILTALIATLLTCTSIILFAWNSVYIVNDQYGIMVLIAAVYGTIVSIFSGLTVLAIFLEKNKTDRK